MAGRGGRGGFEPGGFDPKMIVAQIAAMQALLYLSLGAFMLLFNGLSGRPATAVGLEQVLSSRALRLSSPGGTISLMAFFFNALAGGCFLVVVVDLELAGDPLGDDVEDHPEEDPRRHREVDLCWTQASSPLVK